MTTKTKFGIITVVVGIAAFMLSRIIWPDPMDMVMPTAAQLPLFIFLSAMEALSLGAGIAFATLGWKHLQEMMPGAKKRACWTYLAITWFLISWWPHDNMHRVNGHDNLAGLLKIEFLFHFTLILSAFIVAHNFWKFLARPKTS